MNALRKCPDCSAEPGESHGVNCDVERCSACGGQRLQCNCENHDPLFARWTGIWPGQAEASFLGIGLNQFIEQGYNSVFFVKPTQRSQQ
jgi:hypothetical protein